jgi:hypothetical protein
MAKIHTHYDNLKVARLAPQEVIRAAYKALSQKYHPDKNPGDEKAARIMAIINSAYGTLSDPLRRKEHDEWIVAEEWEIDWLESTHEEERGQQRAEAAHGARAVAAPASSGVGRAALWWCALAAALMLGCALGVYLAEQPRMLPAALGSALQARADARADDRVAAGVATGLARLQLQSQAQADADALARRPDLVVDSWAMAPGAGAGAAAAPQIKAQAMTELVVPARVPECDTELHTLVAPNGAAWPAQSGYVDGYPIGNQGNALQVLVDNSANSSPLFVKIHDLERRANVRHAYVLAHATLAIDKLAAGRYEVRYQNVEVGALKGDCGPGGAAAIRRAPGL